MKKEFKQFPALATKVDEAQGIVEAIVSVTGVLDDGLDVIQSGAYAKTLTERGRKIRVLNSHAMWSINDVIGKVLAMREIPREELPADLLERYPDATGGLWTQTQYLLDTVEGKGAFVRIASGAVDEYSIGYEALKVEYEKREDRTVRIIKEIRLWEYSPVVWGMNPATATVGVKSTEGEFDTAALIESAADQVKAGRTLSAANLARIRAAFESLREVLEAAGIMLDETDSMEDDESKAADDRAEPEESTHSEAGAPPAAEEKAALERARLMQLIEIGLAMEAQ